MKETQTETGRTRSFKGQGAQGDMLLTAVDDIPSGFTKCEPEADGTHIVTHSETGHHHVVAAADVDFFQAANEPFVSFIKVKKVTQLRHLRDFDTHIPLQLDPGIFRINRQREYELGGFRQVAD